MGCRTYIIRIFASGYPFSPDEHRRISSASRNPHGQYSVSPDMSVISSLLRVGALSAGASGTPVYTGCAQTVSWCGHCGLPRPVWKPIGEKKPLEKEVGDTTDLFYDISPG